MQRSAGLRSWIERKERRRDVEMKRIKKKKKMENGNERKNGK